MFYGGRVIKFLRLRESINLTSLTKGCWRANGGRYVVAR
jgi:hypothetical protein